MSFKLETLVAALPPHLTLRPLAFSIIGRHVHFSGQTAARTSTFTKASSNSMIGQ